MRPLIRFSDILYSTSIKNKDFSWLLEIWSPHILLGHQTTSSRNQPKQTQQNTMRFFSDKKTHHRFLGIHSRGYSFFLPQTSFNKWPFAWALDSARDLTKTNQASQDSCRLKKNIPKRTLAKVTPWSLREFKQIWRGIKEWISTSPFPAWN